MLGVPESPEGYTFPIEEGQELTEAQKLSRDGWAKAFHEMHLPKSMADAIITRFEDEQAAQREAIELADDRYAEATEAELRVEYGDEYNANRQLAVETARELFGEDFEAIKSATLANDRLMLDSPFMVRMLVRIGREMNEKGVDLMTDTERGRLDDQIQDVRDRAAKAASEGNTRLANKLFQEEQALLAKIVGNKPITGASPSAT